MVRKAYAESEGTDQVEQRRISISDYTFPLNVSVIAYNLTDSKMNKKR